MQVLTNLFTRHSYSFFILSDVLLDAVAHHLQHVSEVLFCFWKLMNFLESNSRGRVEIMVKVSSLVVLNVRRNVYHSKVSMSGKDFSLNLSKCRPLQGFLKIVINRLDIEKLIFV